MLDKLAVGEVKSGRDPMVPRCFDTWQYSTPATVSQLKPRVLQEKWKIHMIKCNATITLLYQR